MELVAPNLAVNRVCGCAEDHYHHSRTCSFGGGFEGEQIITTENLSPKFVHGVDIDNDGHMDILSAVGGTSGLNKVSWRKNDGNGNFGTEQIITTEGSIARGLLVADINGDSIQDVVLASSQNVANRITWYQNDGNGTFVTGKDITTTNDYANEVQSIFAVDIDGDNDIDIITASYGDNEIGVFKNNGDGLGFWRYTVLTNTANGVGSVYAADVNGDNIPDVLSASYADDQIAWYQNDGSGNVGTKQVITDLAASARNVVAADLDGDGDMDVLSASGNDNKIAWYENDGSGNFGPQQVISNYPETSNAEILHVVDFDKDGDLDVFGLGTQNTDIVWFENNGTGNFVSRTIVSTSNGLSLRDVSTADLNEDGVLDVLVAKSTGAYRIAWYPANTSCIEGCQTCAAGTRLAGDEKMEASQCCVDAYQSAVGATCTAYTEDEASCNALRRPLIEGTEAVDAACGALCDESTEFAEDSACVAFLTTCGPGLFLTGGSNDTQKTCDACPTETFKATNGSEACGACAAGSEVSENRTACTPCLIEERFDDDQNSSTVCAAAVAGCDEGTQFVVTNRTTDNRCDKCPAGQFQELNASTVQCADYTTNATYCNSLNKRFVEGTSIRDSHCFESECLAGEEAIGTKCLCIENYHLVNGVCSACQDGLFRLKGDDKLVDQNTNCTPSGCFVLPNYTSIEFAVGQGECTGSVIHGEACKLQCAAGHQSYAYSCDKGVLTAPSMACSKCKKHQHSVDGDCTDDTAYLACNCTSAACPESGDTFFSIGRYDRDDSECRQATWVEEQVGQEVERPTTEYAIKGVFESMAIVFQAPVQAGNTTQPATKEEKREQFESIVAYIKDEIEAMPNRRIEIPKEVMVLSDDFIESLGDREKVELVIPTPKTKIMDPSSACDEKDVDLAAQVAAYDVSLAQGDTSLLCRGTEPVTKLEKVQNGYEYACFDNGAWLNKESIQHDEKYECTGKKFYVNSHSGLTCTVTKPVSVENENIVTGTNIDCGLTLAEGENCQTQCNPNYEKVSEANCTADGFQPATCKCEKDGYSEDMFGNCKRCDVGSYSNGNGAPCQEWSVSAEICNTQSKVFLPGNATKDATCGEECPEGLVAEWGHCTDPNKQIHCDTLSWFYFSGACCDSFDNTPTCLNQMDRAAVPLMQSLSYVRRNDRTECQDGDQIVFKAGSIV